MLDVASSVVNFRNILYDMNKEIIAEKQMKVYVSAIVFITYMEERAI